MFFFFLITNLPFLKPIDGSIGIHRPSKLQSLSLNDPFPMLYIESSLIFAVEVEDYVKGREWRINVDSCLLQNDLKVGQLKNLIGIGLELYEVSKRDHVYKTCDWHFRVIMELP